MNLSPKTLWFAGLVALLGIAGQWAGSPYADWWRYPTAGVFLLLALEWVVAYRLPLAVRVAAPPRVRLGRPDELELEWHNASRRPVRIEFALVPADWLHPDVSRDQAGLRARSSRVWRTRMEARRLGEFVWPAMHARVEGVFGLAWWNRRFRLTETVEVLPDTLGRRGRREGMADSGQLARPVTGAGDEFRSLRDYRPGDPLRAVDWKATARRGRPVVREFEESQQLELMLLVDAGRYSNVRAGRMPRFAHYINVAARLAELAIRKGDEVGLIVFADEPLQVLPPVRGQSGLRRIRGLLEQTTVRETESNPLAGVLRMRRLVRLRSLVVILTDLDDPDSAGQLVQAGQLLRPKHLPMVASVRDENLDRIRFRRADNWLDPWKALAAEELLEHVRGTMMRLGRLGGHVVHVPAGRLDAEVMSVYRELRRRHLV